MAKKTSKTGRGDEYRAIMTKDGFGPDEWRVLAFVFLSDTGLKIDHSETWKRFHENGVFKELERMIKNDLIKNGKIS